MKQLLLIAALILPLQGCVMVDEIIKESTGISPLGVADMIVLINPQLSRTSSIRTIYIGGPDSDHDVIDDELFEDLAKLIEKHDPWDRSIKARAFCYEQSTDTEARKRCWEDATTRSIRGQSLIVLTRDPLGPLE